MITKERINAITDPEKRSQARDLYLRLVDIIDKSAPPILVARTDIKASKAMSEYYGIPCLRNIVLPNGRYTTLDDATAVNFDHPKDPIIDYKLNKHGVYVLTRSVHENTLGFYRYGAGKCEQEHKYEHGNLVTRYDTLVVGDEMVGLRNSKNGNIPLTVHELDSGALNRPQELRMQEPVKSIFTGLGGKGAHIVQHNYKHFWDGDRDACKREKVSGALVGVTSIVAVDESKRAVDNGSTTTIITMGEDGQFTEGIKYDRIAVSSDNLTHVIEHDKKYILNYSRSGVHVIRIDGVLLGRTAKSAMGKTEVMAIDKEFNKLILAGSGMVKTYDLNEFQLVPELPKTTTKIDLF